MNSRSVQEHFVDDVQPEGCAKSLRGRRRAHQALLPVRLRHRRHGSRQGEIPISHAARPDQRRAVRARRPGSGRGLGGASTRCSFVSPPRWRRLGRAQENAREPGIAIGHEDGVEWSICPSLPPGRRSPRSGDAPPRRCRAARCRRQKFPRYARAAHQAYRSGSVDTNTIWVAPEATPLAESRRPRSTPLQRSRADVGA